MATAEEYRRELEALQARIVSDVDSYARGGYVSPAQADSFLSGLGLRAEDAETRTAREVLEAFKRQVSTELAAQTSLSEDYRRTAQRAWGV